LIPGFAKSLFAEQKAHIMGVPTDQRAVAVARVTKGVACTPKDPAVLISNDSIAIFEVGFITDDLVVTVAYEFSSKHFEISPDQLFAAEDQKLE